MHGRWSQFCIRLFYRELGLKCHVLRRVRRNACTDTKYCSLLVRLSVTCYASNVQMGGCTIEHPSRTLGIAIAAASRVFGRAASRCRRHREMKIVPCAISLRLARLTLTPQRLSILSLT